MLKPLMAFDDFWFADFCALESDRGRLVSEAMIALGITPCANPTPPWTHWQSFAGLPASGELVLVAHYDRHPGTPGANDNGASVRYLLDYLSRTRTKPPFRVVFTDGEEIFQNREAARQGARLLGECWKSAGRIPNVVVFDMTGVGDTFVLGHLSQKIKKNAGLTETGETKSLRLWTRRLLASTGAGDFIEIDTPFSDDLGFLWAGIPSVQISLLPRKQALAYRKRKEADATDETLPDAWKSMHTERDVPGSLWPQSGKLVAELLDRAGSIPFLR